MSEVMQDDLPTRGDKPASDQPQFTPKPILGNTPPQPLIKRVLPYFIVGTIVVNILPSIGALLGSSALEEFFTLALPWINGAYIVAFIALICFALYGRR